jgi:Acyclic terpene utilisation family protein AtuA
VTETAVIVPVGAIGAGVRAEDVRRGIAFGAHAIAADAGSTDSGPYYLATGISKYSREAVAHDLRILMAVREEAGIPLLIGSCGTSGCDDAVDWTLEIALDIARELGQSPRIAVLYSEQPAERIKAMNAVGAVSALAPSGPLTAGAIDSCTHIVAVMGPEPYVAALEAGADIVLGGRTTDTAVLAAVPLMRGAGAGPAWHAGKVAECGGQCTVDPTDGGVLIRVRAESFDVEPLSARNRCDPHSVSAHMLYENSDPYRLVEPGGVLEVNDADYRPLDDRVVRVTGSRFAPAPYTMKLEGAGPGPFQTIMFIGIADPTVLASLDLFVDRLSSALYERVHNTLGAAAGDFDISLRAYGWNALSGHPLPQGTLPPSEVGIMFVATAATQAIATRIAKACNSHFFHFPLRRDVELPSYAFPFSPAEIERGQVFEFRMNHVIHVDDPLAFVRTRWIDVAKPEIARA